MTGVRSNVSGSRNRPRIRRTRENGMRSVSRVTRLAVAVSLVLSAVFSAIAAIGFAGRASATTAGSSRTTAPNGSSAGVRVALPPKGDAGSASEPVAPPVSQPVTQVPPPVTSGGS